MALLLGIGHASQLVQEAIHRVHIDQVRTQFMPEHLHHLLRLALAQQAVVHVYAGQTVTNGANQQRRDYRGIYATGQRQQHLAVAHLRADALDLVVDEILRVPCPAATALVEHELR